MELIFVTENKDRLDEAKVKDRKNEYQNDDIYKGLVNWTDGDASELAELVEKIDRA